MRVRRCNTSLRAAIMCHNEWISAALQRIGDNFWTPLSLPLFKIISDMLEKEDERKLMKEMELQQRVVGKIKAIKEGTAIAFWVAMELHESHRKLQRLSYFF